jgi:hypothetical protein
MLCQDQMLRRTGNLLVAALLLAGCEGIDNEWNGFVFSDAGAAWEAGAPRTIYDPMPAGTGGASGSAGGNGGGQGSDPGAGGMSGGGSTPGSCNVGKAECPMGQSCYPSVLAEGEENGGVCQEQGKQGYKGRCAVHTDCSAGLICSPESGQGCRWGCDPTKPSCPDGGTCVSLMRYNRTGYCGDP